MDRSETQTQSENGDTARGSQPGQGSVHESAARSTVAEAGASLGRGSDTVVETAKAAVGRGHRVSAAVLENARSGQHEILGVVGAWASAPFNILGFWTEVAEANARTQARNFDLIRLCVAEGQGAAEETRALADQTVAVAGHGLLQLGARGLNLATRRPSSFLIGAEERRESELDEHQRQLDVAYATASDVGLYLFSIIGERETVPIEEAAANIEPPDGWLALARLLGAGLVAENGRSLYLTPRGRRLLQEFLETSTA